MTDKDMLDRVRVAVNTLARGKIPEAQAHLLGLSADLEANPPLAEVEGLFVHIDGEPRLLQAKGIALGGVEVPLRAKHYTECDVTVTIRERGLEPVG